MDEKKARVNEESLDPQDWHAMRDLGHKLVDDMMTHLETVRQRPAWRPIPNEVRAKLNGPVPLEPQGAEQAYADFVEQVLPYPLGNTHPRFWGWVIGTGTPLGMFAEMLAAGMNATVFGGQSAPALVEEQTLDWCKEMLGYPMNSSGLLVSGGTVANLIGLTVARNMKADGDVVAEGLDALPAKMVFYGSSETHSSVVKAAMLLGLGVQSFRKIPVNSDYQIDLQALRKQINRDRNAGYHPFCIVGNAGTVNTGTFDDLNALADLCETEGLWFHVDGAFGALAALSPRLRPLTAGMERADSLAFDLHKWMYMCYEAGCVLVRNAQDHLRAFSGSAAYLAHNPRGVASGTTWFSELGLQLSRGFRALKIWMSLKEHGLDRFGRLIEQNVEQAGYLVGLIAQQPALELMAPVPLNIVCFRFVDRSLEESSLDELNREILMQLQELGIAVPSSTILEGRFAIRVAITNHRSRREDFDLLVNKVLEIGRACVHASSPTVSHR